MWFGNLALSFVFILVAFLFLLYTIYLIKRNKFLLRYSLMWIVLSIGIFVFAVFPLPIFTFARFLGFDAGSNFIFSIAIFFLLIICLIQTRAISQQAMKEKRLTQESALMKYQLSKITEKNDNQSR